MRVLEHRFTHISQEARRGRAWLAGLQPLYDGLLPADAIVPEDALLSYYHLGAIVLAVERGPARIVVRTPQRVAAQMLDHVVLRAHSGGPIQVEAADWADRAGSGDLVLFNLAEPVGLAMPTGTSVTVVVPRRRLVGAVADGRAPRGRILDGGREPLVRLLSGHLRDLADTLGAATPAQLTELGPATLALCRIAVAATARQNRDREPDGGPAAARDGPDPLALAVRRYIEANVATVDLPALRGQFGLSRNTLYQLFTDAGGVHAYIRQRRLSRALRELTEPGLGRRPKLARLAHECGFSGPQVFSRAFRRQFGISPMQVERRRVPIAAGSSEPPLLAWLRDL
ncbi:AraC family transcriptional regulator [Methylobacterium sp. NPDC080182]|uniref:helix-turn-helix transcriptional regulator n=1 Tax=Methylobacterium sp. NPDC080182 TaxID=3390590 RepID=UPI003D0707DF